VTIVFQPATRQSARLLIGLGGGTGSGKTYSALLLATGLAGRGGKIAVIDTEDGRALEYAPLPGVAPNFTSSFSFASALLNEPFTPARYEECILAAGNYVGEGGVVIIDSMSHEWEGPGGLLEQANTIAMRMAAKHNKSPDVYSVPSWAEPKKQHWAMVNSIKRVKSHLIFCFRAKEKLRMIPGKAPVPRGIRPIGEESLPYEMSFFAVFDNENPGVPLFTVKPMSLTLRGIFRDGEKITEDLGRRLKEHADGKAIDKAAVLAAAKKIFAESGIDGLKTHVEGISKAEGAYLRSVWKEVIAKEEVSEDAA
jgi:AAA domain-containing protein